jgi:hypothetical protein
MADTPKWPNKQEYSLAEKNVQQILKDRGTEWNAVRAILVALDCERRNLVVNPLHLPVDEVLLGEVQ